MLPMRCQQLLRQGERRDRLRKMMAQRDAEFADAPALGQIVLQEQVAVSNELFYTEGPEELKQARNEVAQFSLKRAAQRIQNVKRRRQDLEAGEVSRNRGIVPHPHHLSFPTTV